MWHGGTEHDLGNRHPSRLSDNYAYLAHDPATGATAVVDVPEAAPVLAALRARGWTLSDVLLTHHHDDHVQGLAALLAEAPARVIGAAADAHPHAPCSSHPEGVCV